MVKNLPANAGDVGLIPGSGRSPRGGNSNSLQYSCLKNPTDRGAWRAYSPWGWWVNTTWWLNKFPLPYLMEPTYTSVISHLLKTEQADEEVWWPVTPLSCICAGRTCFKVWGSASLAPGSYTPSGNSGATGASRGGYISFHLLAKDSREQKRSDGYILLCLNNICFCCF